MTKIVIIDYGMGNLRSVQKALESVGQKALITSDASVIESAEKMVFPGVGAFGAGMKELEQRGLVEPIIKFIASGRLFLGICLGLQLLFTESEEEGLQKGLGIIKGRVKKFPDKGLKIPHMGWNRIKKVKEFPLLEDIADNTYMYFVHSYYVEPEDKAIVATTTNHGIKFTSSIYKDNIQAMQFHPEKSQEAGLKILENFTKV
ncbi:MAG: imidazole glycerol phosphate synthase subunit HisH [Candidatus Omnitrophica bacterium]|nr:imidazole glycerol phosphate synthase subunit HisH [Candidatus Omnitrophota bacterium]